VSTVWRPFPALLWACVILAPLAGCSDASQKAAMHEPSGRSNYPRVAMEIRSDGEVWGNLVFELDRDKAPITTDSFIRYVNEHYFDGTIIHRVTTGPRIHVLQGGGYTALNAPSKPGQHDAIKNEANNGLKNLRGTIAMARDAAPHTATSEFFVNLKDNPSLDFPGRDGWGYCVFGKLVLGEDVLDRIAAIETRVNPDPQLKGEKSQPINPPIVHKASIWPSH